ncbi:MAG: twin-arginine translocase TatA/TatE family subunit [SAR324 cluster bacterium]|nr:twin-arginine translocase TatA/TatE family subunit [SAR324 cluster bacterium]
MIGGLGVGELSIILCIVVVLFGAGRLAGIGAGLGKGIRNFKKEIDPLEKKKLEEKANKDAEEKTEDKDSVV